jgi:two-component sensor histidine kinase
MALVHEYLYQSENLAQIDFGEYLRHLIDDLLRLYGHRAGAVSIQIDVSGPDTRGTDTTKVIWLDIHSAIPCGLIVQELVSNALKHAFPEGRAGQIWVELRADESELILRVCDDGVGLPKDMDFQYTESMGLQLVNMLTLQLKGNIELEQDSGTAFKLTLIRPVVQEGDLNDRNSSLSR